MEDATRQALRALPAVEESLNHPAAARLLVKYPRTQVVEAVRAALEAARRQILAAAGGLAPTPEDLLGRAAVVLEEWALPGLRPVLNLTGVVIHTNLGRAPLSEAAVEQVVQVARSYSNLEYDVDGRGARLAREPRGGPPHPAHRGRGRVRGQQQRRGGASSPHGARLGTRGARVPRSAGRDRRVVPPARHHARRRRQPCRSGDHQPHARRGLRGGHHCRDRPAPARAHLELPDHGLHRGGRPGRTGGIGAEPGRDRRGRPGQRRPARSGRLPGRAHRRGLVARRGRRRLLQRGQTARRPAGRHTRRAAGDHRPSAQASGRAGAAPGQDDPGGPRGDAAGLSGSRGERAGTSPSSGLSRALPRRPLPWPAGYWRR